MKGISVASQQALRQPSNMLLRSGLFLRRPRAAIITTRAYIVTNVSLPSQSGFTPKMPVPILDPHLYPGQTSPFAGRTGKAATKTTTATMMQTQLLHSRTKAQQQDDSLLDESAAAAAAAPPHVPARPILEAPPMLQHWYSRAGAQITAPFHAYSRAQNHHPYVVQFLTALVIYFLGDLAAQYITRPRTQEELEKKFPDAVATASATTRAANAGEEPSIAEYYEPARAFRSLVIGGISAIPSYHWHVYLSHSFNVGKSHAASLGVKILVQQFFYTPVFNAYFFFMNAALAPSPPPDSSSASSSGEDAEEAAQHNGVVATIKRKCEDGIHRAVSTVPVSWINSFKFWPIVTAFSFTFVPVDMRSVFAGAAAVGWNSYLLVLNQRAVEAEQQRRESGK